MCPGIADISDRVPFNHRYVQGLQKICVGAAVLKYESEEYLKWYVPANQQVLPSDGVCHDVSIKMRAEQNEGGFNILHFRTHMRIALLTISEYTHMSIALRTVSEQTNVKSVYVIMTNRAKLALLYDRVFIQSQ